MWSSCGYSFLLWLSWMWIGILQLFVLWIVFAAVQAMFTRIQYKTLMGSNTLENILPNGNTPQHAAPFDLTVHYEITVAESPTRLLPKKKNNLRKKGKTVMPSPPCASSSNASIIEMKRGRSSVFSEFSADYTLDSAELENISDTVYENSFPKGPSIAQMAMLRGSVEWYKEVDSPNLAMPPLPPQREESPEPDKFLDHTYENIDPFARSQKKSSSKKIWKKRASSLLNVLKRRSTNPKHCPEKERDRRQKKNEPERIRGTMRAQKTYNKFCKYPITK